MSFISEQETLTHVKLTVCICIPYAPTYFVLGRWNEGAKRKKRFSPLTKLFRIRFIV